MRNRKIERMTLVTCSLAACVAFTLAAGQAQARGMGAGGHGLGAMRGRSGAPLLDGAPAMQPHFNPSNSLYLAAIARDSRFTGKSGVGIWATLSTAINRSGCCRAPLPRAIRPIQPRIVRDP